MIRGMKSDFESLRDVKEWPPSKVVVSSDVEESEKSKYEVSDVCCKIQCFLNGKLHSFSRDDMEMISPFLGEINSLMRAKYAS